MGNSTKKLTTEQFIEKAKEVHGDKYDYSKANYINYRTKVEIICPIHGSFFIPPVVLISHKHGCAKCGQEKSKKTQTFTTEQFIEKAKEVHGDKYDYSKANYINSHSEIEIACPIHGSFFQKAYIHLQGHGCPKCVDRKIQLKSTENFIKEAKEIHHNKYDYSFVDYKGNKTKVKIVCPEHGAFYQTPQSHLRGDGCPMCNGSYGEQIIAFLLKNVFKEEFTFQFKTKFCKNKSQLPFDFYLQNRNIMIEYMGEQHYKWIKFYHQTFHDFLIQKHHDWLKRKFCRENNIIYFKIDYNENIYEKLKEILI